MNKKQILALIAKKEEARAALVAKGDASEAVAEIKEIRSQLDAIDVEIRDLNTILEAIPDEEPEQRSGAPLPGSKILGTYGLGAAGAARSDAQEDKFDTMEYRKAFMDYCRTGREIPAEFRSDAFTAVADAAAVIPTTIMNEIIKEMKKYGQLFNRVRKINVQGGVQIPILSLKPVASRITEAAPSERKKMTASTYITFSYYGLECKVATSLLTSTVTLASFEASIVPLITEAMVKQQEIEIIKGTGSGEMLGVAVDTRVAAGQKITISSTDMTDWAAWKKNIFAKIPLAYRAGGLFVMGAGTFDGYIDGMTDANGQPIGRVNYGIADAPQYRFGGKEVIEVEEDVIASYDNASVGDVIGVFFNPGDYAINSNMQMAMYRWLDHDLNQWVDKAILINDGKLVDAAGVIIIKKGA